MFKSLTPYHSNKAKSLCVSRPTGFFLSALKQSAHQHLIARHNAQELGVNHYMGKPYDEDDLLARIRQCIEKKP